MKLLKANLLISLCLTTCAVLSAQSIEINRNNKTIAISTSDEATAPADIAAITIGFEIYGQDSSSLSSRAGELSHAILDALHKAGVEDKAIESKSQSVERNSSFDEKATKYEQGTMPFVFSQSWEVRVTPEMAAHTIGSAIAAGANDSGSITWLLSDRKGLQAKAAENALIKARAVAEHMAKGLNVKLGELVYASNQTPNVRFYGTVNSSAQTVTVSTNAAPVPVVSPIELRPQTIREEATVYAVFSID
jgi:uncharacterized protein YggE